VAWCLTSFAQTEGKSGRPTLQRSVRYFAHGPEPTPPAGQERASTGEGPRGRSPRPAPPPMSVRACWVFCALVLSRVVAGGSSPRKRRKESGVANRRSSIRGKSSRAERRCWGDHPLGRSRPGRFVQVGYHPAGGASGKEQDCSLEGSATLARRSWSALEPTKGCVQAAAQAVGGREQNAFGRQPCGPTIKMREFPGAPATALADRSRRPSNWSF
jgi:hypothetical protein